MRAKEFINEVLSLKEPPQTIWQRDVTDPGRYGPTSPKPEPLLIGSWTDTDGTPVRNIFHPAPDGRSATLYFDRTGPDGKPTFDIIGTGGPKASSILSGVVQNIKVYLTDHPNIKTINLHSEEPSRTRLYASIIDRLAADMGWVGTASNVKQVISGPGKPTGGSGDFTLTKATGGGTHAPIAPSVKAQLKVPTEPPRPKDPNSPGVDLTRPPRNRPLAQPPLPPGKAIPFSMVGKAFTPSFVGSHDNSFNAQAFQATQDYIKRNMPRI